MSVLVDDHIGDVRADVIGDATVQDGSQGSIVKIGWAESVLELEKDYVAAYQIQLANSEDLVYAPNDTDEYVRPYVDSPPAKRRKLDK